MRRPRTAAALLAVAAGLMGAALLAPPVSAVTGPSAMAAPVVHAAAPAAPAARVATSTRHRALALHVAGDRIVNSRGQNVRLIGFNNSGAEYACMEGWGIFDVQTATNTSVPTSYVRAMAKWSGANAVRIQLNEQCWLGLAGVNPAYSGANYQNAIKTYVRQLTNHGFAVIMDLHLSAPGSESSLNQEEMPDGHSVRFWRQVGRTFKHNRAVIFDLFNEPWPDNQSESRSAWKCWRDGGCELSSQNGGQAYRAVGMNQLITAVRSSGARNIVMAGGLNFASDLAHWLKFEPTDPDHELAASIHLYSFGGCNSLACYEGAPAKVSRHVPLVIGELGADLDPDYTGNGNCPPSDSGTNGFDHTVLRWARQHHASWTAWTWNPWGDCLSLVSDFAGHPTSPYGVRIRQALAAEQQSHRA